MDQPIVSGDPELTTTLKRDAVGLGGLIAQSLGTMAPEMSAVVIASAVAAQAGASTPFAFVMAGVGTLGLARVYGRFATVVPDAGGSYAIVREAMGKDVAFVAGWALIAMGSVFFPALVIAAAFVLKMVLSGAAADIPWFPQSWMFWAAALGAPLLYLCHRGIELSANVLLFLTAVGVCLLLVFDAVILGKGGASGISWTALWPGHAGFGGLALGVGIAMTGYAGFESAVYLGEEARAATRQVPLAIISSVAIAFGFFLLTTLAIVSGYGMHDAAKLWPAESAGAVVSLSTRFLSEGFGQVLFVFLALSSLASALGTANAAARLFFSWGRERHLPAIFGKTHARFGTPTAGVVALAFSLFVTIGAGWWLFGGESEGAATLFNFLLLCGATAALPVYGLVALGALVARRRLGGNLFDGTVAPIAALVVVALAMASQIHPVPPPPYRYAMPAMAFWLAAGVGVRWFRRTPGSDH